MDIHWKQSELFFEFNVNHKILETVQIDYTKACSALEQASVSIFCWHLLKIFSTHFITLVSFYSTCNISENQRFPDHLLGHRKRPVTWNDWKSFNHHLLILLLIYVTEDNLYNWKVTYKKWNCWFSSSNLSPIILILFFLTLL